MLKITTNPSEKIEGAVEVTLETLLSRKTVFTSECEATHVMDCIANDCRVWLDTVDNLNEVGEGSSPECSPTSIIISLDYANTPDQNSNVYYVVKDAEGTYTRTYTLRGFNRTGVLMKAAGKLTATIKDSLSHLEETPSQNLPGWAVYRIMFEAMGNGMEYSMDTFAEDVKTPYIYRNMILKALTYLKVPFHIEMVEREVFGWSRGMKEAEL